jgi:hypothetical protein
MADQQDNQPNRLFTLSEVSEKTGISMPTLQRYKKMYQDRIPAEGKGRKQRYPENALPIFAEIRNENAGKRGRPRKDASAPRPAKAAATRGVRGRRGRPAGTPARKATGRGGARKGAGRPAKAAPAAAVKTARGAQKRGGRKSASGSNLLTLTQISKTTGISYPTLVRYVRLHAERLPSEGAGRARRFYPQAVDVFRQLRGESGRGGRKKGSGAAKTAARGRGRAAAAPASESMLTKRLHDLERGQQQLEKRLRGFVQSIQKLFS